jgi:hypothetical protein
MHDDDFIAKTRTEPSLRNKFAAKDAALLWNAPPRYF